VLLKFGGAGDIVVASDVARPDWRLFLDYHLVPGLYRAQRLHGGLRLGAQTGLRGFCSWMSAARAHTEPSTGSPHRFRRAATAFSAYPISSARRRLSRTRSRARRFTGLSLGHTQAHLWRALLEAVAFGFRHHVEVARRNRLWAEALPRFGRRHAQRVWMQIVADVLQAPVRLVETAHGSAIGAAFVARSPRAAMSIGRMRGAWRGLATPSFPIPPTPPFTSAPYRDYRALYAALQPIFRLRAS